MNAGSIFIRFTIILLVVGLITTGIQAKSEARVEKNKIQIDNYIKQAGSMAPDWWNSVELSYPETLDMNWPVQEGFLQGRPEFGGRGGRGFPGERGGRGRSGSGERVGRGWQGGRGEPGFPGERGGRGWPGERGGRGFPGERGDRGFGWEQSLQTSVDQYLIQVVYPNPSRHKEGIKLVNHLMILHKDDKEKLKRSLNTLGEMFYELFNDYTRAAFWWQKYAERGGSID